jgi:hypothetical protein
MLEREIVWPSWRDGWQSIDGWPSEKLVIKQKDGWL